MKKFILLFVIVFSLSTIKIYSQDTVINEYKFKAYTTLGMNLILSNGTWGGTVPATPVESTVSIAGTQYYAPGFGININYHFMENLSFYFDINMYKRKIPVAYNGGYASSMWIFEQTDYTYNKIGPFDEDVFYFVKTTGFRLGLKAYLQHKSNVQPWIGAYWGYYSVNHGIYNEKQNLTYGNSTDEVTGLTYMNLGVDFWDKSKSFALTLFVEGGAPVDRNYTIENCLETGWTYQDYGEGEHIFGYYRVGISINSWSSKK